MTEAEDVAFYLVHVGVGPLHPDIVFRLKRAGVLESVEDPSEAPVLAAPYDRMTESELSGVLEVLL